ncbi:MAG: sugar phosphate isomerase/epimerase [Clostridia bacterium]|nr:sugar phosphate isomerase/epimerase [Clostridia bacterium]
MELRTRLLGSNGTFSRDPLSRALAETRRLGFTRLDFIPQTPHFWCGHTGYEDPAPLKAMLAAANLGVSVLTPPAYRYSITAPEGRQREATLRYYINCIALAAELGCTRLVLGAAGACWDTPPEVLRKAARGLLSALCPAAEAAGVTLLLTPAMGADTPLIAESPVLGTAVELAELLDQVDRPCLGACLDICVMSACGDKIADWFRRLGPRTGLVRLCDGNYHGWRAIGEGCLPMGRYLEQIEGAGYRGDFSPYLPGERYCEEPSRPVEAALLRLCGEV